MAKEKRTYNERLHDAKDLPKVEYIGDDPVKSKRYHAETMLIAPPMEYHDIMKNVPEGKLMTIPRMGEILAEAHGADFTCPFTCGLFPKIVAHASVEREAEGQGGLVPYWRTVKSKGELCEKFPGGIEEQKTRLEMEGFTIVQKGSRYFVADFENALYTPAQKPAQ